MRLIAMSDIHGKHGRLSVPEGDILIVAGDVVSSDFEEAADFLAWMGRHRHPHKIFVPGNCDGCLEFDADLMALECERQGISLLMDSGVVIRNQRFWGSPVTPTHGNMAFNRDPGGAIRRHWDLIPNDCQVLITHGPPFGILDQISPSENTRHLGCPDLAAKVEQVRPRIHIFGHIHGGFGSIVKNGTRFYNVAVCTERFQATNGVTVINYEMEI